MSWRTFAGSLVGVAFFLVIYSWTWYTSGDYYDYYYGDGRDSYSTSSSYYGDSTYSPGGPGSGYSSPGGPSSDYSSPTSDYSSGYSNPGDYSTGTSSSYSNGPYESTTNSFSDDAAAPPAEPSPSEFPSSSLYEPN